VEIHLHPCAEDQSCSRARGCVEVLTAMPQCSRCTMTLAEGETACSLCGRPVESALPPLVTCDRSTRLRPVLADLHASLAISPPEGWFRISVPWLSTHGLLPRGLRCGSTA
jgi:hypothetical protein